MEGGVTPDYVCTDSSTNLYAQLLSYQMSPCQATQNIGKVMEN